MLHRSSAMLKCSLQTYYVGLIPSPHGSNMGLRITCCARSESHSVIGPYRTTGAQHAPGEGHERWCIYRLYWTT